MAQENNTDPKYVQIDKEGGKTNPGSVREHLENVDKQNELNYTSEQWNSQLYSNQNTDPNSNYDNDRKGRK